MSLDQPDFEHLLALRTGLRRFFHWSEQQAKRVGITPSQHQLLLAIRGHADPSGPTVGDVADYLVLRHHSAVGLIDRAVAAGLVVRAPDPGSRSSVRLALTPVGLDKLDVLSETHLDELRHLAPAMFSLWEALESHKHDQTNGSPGKFTLGLEPAPLAPLSRR
jgi:DNA-binding MarR family transcriptional regulator